MTRKRTHPRQRKGYVFSDPLLDYAKGYARLEKATQNSMELSGELDVASFLFPTRTVPVEDRPGYVTYERDYFSIDYPDASVKKDLERYFAAEHSIFRHDLFGSHGGLGGFFESIAKQLLIVGESFYWMDWDEVDIGENKYQLPLSFDYVNAGTTKAVKKAGVVDSYVQKYSLFTYWRERQIGLGSMFKDYMDNVKPRTVNFSKDEIFHCVYPFAKKTPTAASMKFLPTVRAFWQFGLNQGKGNNELDNYYLPIERARHTTYAAEKRKYDIARAKIRTAYNYLIDPNGPQITEYYDLFVAVRFKKFLNDFRDYLVREFNSEVLERVKVKNNLADTPQLKYSGFVTNQEIDNAFRAYESGALSLEEFTEAVIKKP